MRWKDVRSRNLAQIEYQINGSGMARATSMGSGHGEQRLPDPPLTAAAYQSHRAT
jgi:hypothetical protein